tara:strand:- start:701 stop:919 length:219 start_codon:yes stop_codon:yes gene_type:complete
MPTHDEDGIRYMLGKLEGKIDALISSVQKQTSDIQEHEKRLRILETSKAWVLGWSSAAAILASVAIHYIFKR